MKTPDVWQMLHYEIFFVRQTFMFQSDTFLLNLQRGVAEIVTIDIKKKH